MVCSDCKEEKTIRAKGLCKKCYDRMNMAKWRLNNPEKDKLNNQKWRLQNPQKIKEIKKKNYQKYKLEKIKYAEMIRRNAGMLPFYENKECALYLGVHVAERILSHVFDDVERMIINNPGYDFICNKGKKIDVKSSCIFPYKKIYKRWRFSINKNNIADYFLCLAFDNRNDLNPLYVWLIPGEFVNMKYQFSISNKNISLFEKYKLDINDVVSCCNEIKK